MQVKAYIVTEIGNHEKSTLVYATTANEAKVKAFTDEIFENVSYIDLRVNRAKYADGHESAT